jgi:hypothetical protein
MRILSLIYDYWFIGPWRYILKHLFHDLVILIRNKLWLSSWVKVKKLFEFTEATVNSCLDPTSNEILNFLIRLLTNHIEELLILMISTCILYRFVSFINWNSRGTVSPKNHHLVLPVILTLWCNAISNHKIGRSTSSGSPRWAILIEYILTWIWYVIQRRETLRFHMIRLNFSLEWGHFLLFGKLQWPPARLQEDLILQLSWRDDQFIVSGERLLGCGVREKFHALH